MQVRSNTYKSLVIYWQWQNMYGDAKTTPKCAAYHIILQECKIASTLHLLLISRPFRIVDALIFHLPSWVIHCDKSFCRWLGTAHLYDGDILNQLNTIYL